MSKKKIENMEFEEALGELETLVGSLEDRNIKLKDALEAFERGKRLHDHCSEQLKEAENRIRVYTKEGEFEGELPEQSE